MHKLATFPGLLICGAALCVPAVAQETGGPAARAPAASANAPSPASATQMETRANADVAAASANAAGGPVVNPPDPQNAGTLAESARTTAIAGYP